MPEYLDFYRVIVAAFAGHRLNYFDRSLGQLFGFYDEITQQASSRSSSLHRYQQMLIYLSKFVCKKSFSH